MDELVVTVNKSETKNSRLALGKHPDLQSRILRRLSNRQHSHRGTGGQEGNEIKQAELGERYLKSN